MLDYLNTNSDDEIDLREFFIILWAYKLFIAGTCALGIMFGGYYALNADKEFSSTAIFKLDQGNSNGISIGRNLSALASMAGYGGGASSSTLPLDLVLSLIHI